MIEQLRQSQALCTLGLLNGDQIVGICLDAISNDITSNDLAYIAGCLNPIMSEIKPTFLSALEKLGLPRISLDESVQIALEYYAQQILDENIGIYEGLRLIKTNLQDPFGYVKDNKTLGSYLQISELLGSYYSYDDLIESRFNISKQEYEVEESKIREESLNACNKFLKSSYSRRVEGSREDT